MKMKLFGPISVSQCKDCGSYDISWHTANTIKTDIAQGRLRTNDVECIFVLGCDDCSATLSIIPADTMADLINENASK